MEEINEEYVKRILKLPSLPKSIQGDGRYLMTLLNNFLEEMAGQVNLANGFSAEEIKPTAGAYPTPRDFYLSFTRAGGLFTWSHLADLSNLSYYELRTDISISSPYGVLERTVRNQSDKLPVNYSDTVYLYAVSKDGVYSNPSVLNYTKARPDAPQDIAVTNTSEGTLITFLAIPSNCIGAHVYIDGNMYDTLDNVFLVKGGGKIKSVEVAYYDNFGEGERGYLYLILPDVTGFLVERNGSELDFYWDAINIYGVKYLVKVGTELSWEQATELFRTSTNDKNRRLYPNTGTYYLMVKAYDDNGNYSENAAYQIMDNVPDIQRNVILKFPQQDVLYNGVKINTFYDPVIEGVTLDREADYGEYIFDVKLDQRYRARNWLESGLMSVTKSTLVWVDSDFTWGEAEQSWAGLIGDADSSIFKQEIALKTEGGVDSLFTADFNGKLTTDEGIEPTKKQHADDYTGGRWAQGLKITDLTILEYDVPLQTREFSMVFYLRATGALSDCSLITLTNNDKDYMRLGYNRTEKHFYLVTSGGVTLTVPFDSTKQDYFTFGISQDEGELMLLVNSLNRQQTYYNVTTAEPLGVFTKIYAYPKIIM